MGGNAIKSSQRLSKKEFDQYSSEIVALFPELKMHITKSYRQKQDFGDIDIVVQKISNLDIKQLVKDRVNPSEYYDNGPFFSFLYTDVAQVDFILMPECDFETCCHYTNWNDISNFIGRTARSLNFKLGHDGLSYDKHLSNHKKISVIVSKDIETILGFLGYDYDRYMRGFDTEDEICEFAINSPLFNSLYFELEHQNNTDRVRNKKRKMYQKILKYIEEKKITPKPKLTEEERQVHYERAREVFGDDFHNEVLREISQYEKSAKRASKFNGNVIREITKIEDGKMLGKFMAYMKNKHEELLEDHLDDDTFDLESLIREGLKEFFKEEKL